MILRAGGKGFCPPEVLGNCKEVIERLIYLIFPAALWPLEVTYSVTGIRNMDYLKNAAHVTQCGCYKN
jgi:hypothetical protein